MIEKSAAALAGKKPGLRTSSSNNKWNPVPCPEFSHVECVHAGGPQEQDGKEDGRWE